MMNYIISIIGYFLIWLAVDYGRTPESKIPLCSRGFWIQTLLIIIGTFIISRVDEWYPITF